MDLKNNDHSTGSMRPFDVHSTAPTGPKHETFDLPEASEVSEKEVSLVCDDCKICYRAPESQKDKCEFCKSENIKVVSDEHAIQLVREELSLR